MNRALDELGRFLSEAVRTPAFGLPNFWFELKREGLYLQWGDEGAYMGNYGGWRKEVLVEWDEASGCYRAAGRYIVYQTGEPDQITAIAPIVQSDPRAWLAWLRDI